MSPKFAMVENQSPTEMASIESLAFETLSQISSLLCKSSMKSFRLVCRGFCDVVTPLIFDSIFVSARHFDLEVSNLVALRFPDSIKTLTFGSVRHLNPEEERIQNLDIRELLAVYTRKIKTPQCRDSKLHSRTANHLSDLYCKLLIEALNLYNTGALHAHLCHLLDTLPKLRQIVITDKRRRQDVSWYQEALMDKNLLRRVDLPLVNVPPGRQNRSPLLLSNFCKHWQDIKPQRSLGEFRGWFGRHLHRVAIQSPAEQPTLESVGCHCFEQDGDEKLSWGSSSYSWGLSSNLGEGGFWWMPKHPWSVIMIALNKSKSTAVDAVSIRSRKKEGRLPIETWRRDDPNIFMSAASVLAHVTTLELRLRQAGADTNEMNHFWKPGISLLSAAPRLQSLTIDFFTGQVFTDPYHINNGRPPTSFEMFLGGCKLPYLSKLHLHHLTLLEEHLLPFLLESPELRDLSLEEVFMVENTPNPRPFEALTPVNPQAWGRVLQTIKETLHQMQYFDLSDRRYIQSPEIDHLLLARIARHFMLDDGINPFLEIAELRLLDEE